VPGLKLHIVGCNPLVPSDISDVVQVHGLLNAGDSEDAEILRKLFLESHFLIVPTQAECFGLVFVEAHAFGLPPVARAVHAVPSIIEDGVTGLLLDRDAPASQYVERILALVNNRAAYLKMAYAARTRYEEKLNWATFADGTLRRINESLASGKLHDWVWKR
jgi:glycosyltransferase involved in cell wall biosynthesis